MNYDQVRLAAREVEESDSVPTKAVVMARFVRELLDENAVLREALEEKEQDYQDATQDWRDADAENAALRMALIKAAETLQWVADEQPKVIAFDFSEIRQALGVMPHD